MRLVLAAAALAALAVGSPAIAEERQIEVRGLTGIEASGDYDVEVVGGPTASATLEGAPAALSRIEATYADGVLRVRDRCRVGCGPRKLDAVLKVVTPQLASLDISRGIDATVRDVAASNLQIVVQMGAALDIAGRCDVLEARARMGADLDASGLVCREAVVAASMGASAEVHATERVKASASMGADVSVLGNPKQRETSGTMGASISSP